ncbi:similar to Saccharomyces cerevisiae YMR197C VTI1 Protein involved in cis-Golgi membrane traffic [Maudiozyma barnettii]|uniref:Similar to Saccharomyces cerevisiae YMR197C VTI1 Protein involved in cis-Golgi membrane traffic n=1 Tax=Maudiozyma barnettii TaxID=61262 RepID=A0A8H2VBN4_9SACH|nr:v-SNARE protein VTI1 [Kazachstania barnettii]CAB4252293.1 similar to Saccharomyces cerevisiae YMR197C VTI1 Protein involved in cis-Golgi membrane traffic [Kazachstania barnettii]CAD1779005.1 similar to Saccharomyces cerevisiae YMR197C VTI1 Protein involved in cis-Golgi membrane traffic [Kazachstania barnettii]
MNSLLSSYDTEFKTTFDQTEQALQAAKGQSLPERNTTLSHIEEQKDELFDIVDQMDIEVNNSINDPTARANFKSKLRDYRKQINDSIKAPLQNLMDSRDRDMLFGEQFHDGGDQDMSNMNEEQRQQLLANHNILNKTGERLRDASRIANETEGIGSQIMMDLRAQRETLENSRQTLFQADSYVDKSIKTLKVMSRRLIANKFISYAIIAVLILLILLVLFSKFK